MVDIPLDSKKCPESENNIFDMILLCQLSCMRLQRVEIQPTMKYYSRIYKVHTTSNSKLIYQSKIIIIVDSGMSTCPENSYNILDCNMHGGMGNGHCKKY